MFGLGRLVAHGKLHEIYTAKEVKWVYFHENNWYLRFSVLSHRPCLISCGPGRQLALVIQVTTGQHLTIHSRVRVTTCWCYQWLDRGVIQTGAHGKSRPVGPTGDKGSSIWEAVIVSVSRPLSQCCEWSVSRLRVSVKPRFYGQFQYILMWSIEKYIPGILKFNTIRDICIGLP